MVFYKFVGEQRRRHNPAHTAAANSLDKPEMVPVPSMTPDTDTKMSVDPFEATGETTLSTIGLESGPNTKQGWKQNKRPRRGPGEILSQEEQGARFL